MVCTFVFNRCAALCVCVCVWVWVCTSPSASLSLIAFSFVLAIICVCVYTCVSEREYDFCNSYLPPCSRSAIGAAQFCAERNSITFGLVRFMLQEYDVRDSRAVALYLYVLHSTLMGMKLRGRTSWLLHRARYAYFGARIILTDGVLTLT